MAGRTLRELRAGTPQIPAKELVDDLGAVRTHLRSCRLGIVPVGVIDTDGAVLGTRLVRHAAKSAGCTYVFQLDSLAVYVHR